jgi:hypothetical protein
LRLSPRARLDVREDEELSAGVAPTRRLGDGTGWAFGVIELAVAAIGAACKIPAKLARRRCGCSPDRSRE